MQSNTGNQGNASGTTGGNQWSGAKFVKRVEMSAMQFAILAKAQQGEVTRDNPQQLFRGNLQMSGDHFEHCLQQLVQDGHLKEVGGNKYTITDDGREDVQKLFTLVQELPNVVGNTGGQRQGIPQTQGVGGQGGGSAGGKTGGSNVGGSTGGNVGNTGNVGQQNPGQPKGGPGQSSEGRR